MAKKAPIRSMADAMRVAGARQSTEHRREAGRRRMATMTTAEREAFSAAGVAARRMKAKARKRKKI